MKLTLVRDGRPDEGHHERLHDPPLRDDGRRQAEPVATLLAGEGVTAIVASPVQRAQDVLGLEKIVHFRPGYDSATRLIARSGRFGVVSVNESAHFRLP
jgi:Histidine phosphatase superfamily (branch 1)